MVVVTNNLTKIYGAKVGCEKVSISVREGSIFGFLGPNGSGKSTFVKMLIGLIAPTSGTATLLGKPIGDLQVRSQIGFLPENFRYQDWLTGRELLKFHAVLARILPNIHMRRIAEVLRLVSLEDAADRKIGTYSKGMQQRIGIAAALISDPDLLFLDEPTSALDPIGRLEVRGIIMELKSRGKTVFLNSHLLSEVEMVCDEVAIINKGRIVGSGPLNALLGGKVEVDVVAERIHEHSAIENEIASIGKVIKSDGAHFTVELKDRESIPILASIIMRKGGKLYELHRTKDSLERLFMNIIKGDCQ